jgi:hypothetical protein
MSKVLFGKTYLNVEESAEKIGVSEVTLNSYKKLIPRTKIGNRLWWGEDALRKFVESGGTLKQAVHS